MAKCLLILLALFGIANFFLLDYIVPDADAHGIPSQLIRHIVLIGDETFDKQSLSTGETLTINGTLI